LWVDLYNTPEAPPQQKGNWDKVTITEKPVKKKKKMKMERKGNEEMYEREKES